MTPQPPIRDRQGRLVRKPTARSTPQPNVLTEEARPNVLSTQSFGRGQGGTGSAPGPSQSPNRVDANRFTPSNRGTLTAPRQRPAAPADARFEAKPARRRPSFATIVFVGFLVVTAARFLGVAASSFTTGDSTPTSAPFAVGGIELDGGAIAFGVSDGGGLCSLGGAESSFHSGAQVWWTANLNRSLETGEASLVVIVVRDGVDIARSSVALQNLGSNGSNVVCSTQPRVDTQVGRYDLQVWDAAQGTLLASGEYTIEA